MTRMTRISLRTQRNPRLKSSRAALEDLVQIASFSRIHCVRYESRFTKGIQSTKRLGNQAQGVGLTRRLLCSFASISGSVTNPIGNLKILSREETGRQEEEAERFNGRKIEARGRIEDRGWRIEENIQLGLAKMASAIMFPDS